VDLEERSGLGGDVDSGVRSTLGGRGSDAHLTMVHLEDTTARSAPGGYGGQADLTGTEDKAAKLSTVSLIRDEMAVAEDTGWMPQWRIVSTVSLNRDEDLDLEDTGS
jgi:hypothetical protein